VFDGFSPERKSAVAIMVKKARTALIRPQAEAHAQTFVRIKGSKRQGRDSATRRCGYQRGGGSGRSLRARSGVAGCANGHSLRAKKKATMLGLITH